MRAEVRKAKALRKRGPPAKHHPVKSTTTTTSTSTTATESRGRSLGLQRTGGEVEASDDAASQRDEVAVRLECRTLNIK